MKRLFLDFVLRRRGQWNGRFFFQFGHRRRLLGSWAAFRGTRLSPVLDLQHVIFDTIAEAIWITTGVLWEKNVNNIFEVTIRTYRLSDQLLARL